MHARDHELDILMVMALCNNVHFWVQIELVLYLRCKIFDGLTQSFRTLVILDLFGDSTLQ